MRSITLILSLTFLGTFGWTLQTTVSSLFKKETITFPSLQNNIKVLKSLAAINSITIASVPEVKSLEVEFKLAQLEKNLSKVKSTPVRKSVIQNVKIVEASKVASIASLASEEDVYLAFEEEKVNEAASLELNQSPILAEVADEILHDSFDFNLDIKEIHESYDLVGYSPKAEFLYVAINENTAEEKVVLPKMAEVVTEPLMVQDEIKVAYAAPAKNSVPELTREITEEELKIDASDEALLKNLDEEKSEVVAPVAKAKENTQALSTQADVALEEDDLQIYEYEEETAKAAKTQEVQPTPGVSLSVSQVINREMQKSAQEGMGPYKFEKMPKTAAVTPLIATASPSTEAKTTEADKTFEYSNPKVQQFMEEKPVMAQMNTQLKVHALSFSTQIGMSGNLKDFDYQSGYDTTDVKASNNEGELVLEYTLGKVNSSIRSISIKAQDHIPTNLNVEILKNEENEIDVPVLNALALEQYLLKGNKEAEGGMLLVKVSNEIESIGIDKSFSLYLSLDSNLKVTKDENKAAYVMYLGVEPGNALVTVKTKETRFSYVTNIADSELTYDYLPFGKKESVKMELYSEELMSNKPILLNIAGEDLTSFGTGKKSSKLTLNGYEFSEELVKKDGQNYFEVNKGIMDFFFGVKDKNKIYLPSQTYQEEIMRLMNIKNPEESCIIQVNLDQKKNLNSMRALASTKDGLENLEMIALDRDGSLGEDVSDTTTKLFFKGDRQGALNLELTYLDNTEEALQSFCSPGVYLVEQR